MSSNYNVSDDDEEYEDSSLLESDEELSTLIRSRTMETQPYNDNRTTEDGCVEDDVILRPTLEETEKLREEKKEMFEQIVTSWFPKDVNVYARDFDTDEEEEEEETTGFTETTRRDAIISQFVEDAYEQCNQFGRAIGEQGMHCLLQNKDYRNGWNDFKRFVEDIFRSDKYEVNFYHADSTNYWDLAWDGNYDSISMKKMGYFSLGPSIDFPPSEWTMPHEDTWLRTLRNGGFSHVTIIPVTYDLVSSVPRSSKTVSNDHSHQTKSIWIHDPDYDDSLKLTTDTISGDNAPSSSYPLFVKPLSITGNKHVKVYAFEEEIKRKTFLHDEKRGIVTRLYRIIVNFVGQPKTPAWWNTKSKWELVEQNMAKNIETVSNVQNRLETLSIVSTAKRNMDTSNDLLAPECYQRSVTEKLSPVLPATVVSPNEKISAVSVPNVILNSMERTSIEKRKRSTTTSLETTKTTTCGDQAQKKKRRKISSNTMVITPIGADSKEENINKMDDYLDELIRTETQGNLVSHAFESLNEEECFDIYSEYLFDIVEKHLVSERLQRMGNFFANYVLPDVLDADFKVTKLNLSGHTNKETCAFTGLLIQENTAYAVKCFSSKDDKNPSNAFIISNDVKGLNVMVSFIKAIKYYKKMIEMRMDGKCTCSFNRSLNGGIFVKHAVQLRRFKSFISARLSVG